MPYTVFDFRHDIKNLFITPNIRGRFLRMEPGEVHGRHSHDLGDEIFLVLDGQLDMEIDGHHEILGPGQACVAFAHQMHQARNAGDGPMTMYLSVTPHLEPTHTQWDHEGGNKLPFRYGGSTRAERLARTEPPEPIETLVAHHLAASHALADAATANAAAQDSAATELRNALDTGDKTAAKAAIDAMWASIYTMYKQLQEMERAWNELSPAVAGE